MNRKILAAALIVVGVLGGAAANSATDWSTEDYDLYPGDFDGDGKTDLLYVAKDASKPSGIARSDGSGPNIPFQSWPSNYLGIPWHGNLYAVTVADFNGDGRSDILLQRNSPGDHFLLLTAANGKVSGISQTIGNSALGLAWSSDQHKIHAGDFSGDGKADLFLQATRPSGTHAVVLADDNGLFTAGPHQTWTDASWGAFKWSTQNSNALVGDFNGDGRVDLLLQAKPTFAMIDLDVAIPVPTHAPNSNGVVLSQGSSTPFQQIGVQQWSRNALGLDWSSLATNIVVGDFDGNGRADVLLQARRSGQPSYLVSGNGSGAVFTSGSALASNVTWSGDNYRLIAGNFDGTGGAGAYFQALSSSGTNAYANLVTGSSVATSVHKPSDASGVVPVSVVGHTVGSFAVAGTGTATYSIPVVVPAGVAGLQPEISIGYASGSGNGLLGIGWALGGFSEIQRCAKTLVQDNSNDAVQLTMDDRFCLDGNKLRLTGGTYGAAGSTYQTEIETFAKVTAFDSAGNGPARFQIETKNGLIYEYGNTADSRIESLKAGATTTVRAWAVNKVSDRHGNTMTFEYQEDGSPNGSYRPTRINYTSNTAAGLSSAYRVNFYWDPRPASERIESYVAGGLVRETNRLNRIETEYNEPSVGWRLVRRYQLSYNTSGVSGRSRLAAIQECDRNANCLSPTMIGWQEGTSGWSTTPVSSASLPTSAVSRMPIDMNGDGRTDYVFFDTSTNYWRVLFANGDGTHQSPVNIWPSAVGGAMPMDVDGDGKTELLVADSTNNKWVWVRNTGGGSFTGVATTLAVTSSMSTVGSRSMDVNGDGLDDVVFASSSNVYVAFNQFNPANPSAPSFSAPTAVWNTSQFTTIWGGLAIELGKSELQNADFDGDGRDDLLLMTRENTCGNEPNCPVHYVYTWTVLRSTGSAFVAGATAYSSTDAPPSDPMLADLNGDGLTDLIYSAPTANGSMRTWRYWLSGGGSFDTGLNTNGMSGFVSDCDADGYPDLVSLTASENFFCIRSNGSGLASSTSPMSPLGSLMHAADANGDGLPDFVGIDANWNLATWLHRGVLPDLVTTIADGFGNTVSVTYAPLTDASVYTPGSGAIYPEIDIRGPMYFVKQYSASDGIGGSYTVTQKYAGLRAHLQGRGLLGFASRESIDSRTGIKSTWTFRQDHPYIGFVSVSATYQSASGPMIAQVSNTPKQLPAQGGTFEQRYFPYVWESTQTNYEVSTDPAFNGAAIASVKTTTEMDSNGNPTDVTTDTTDLTGSGQTFKTVNSNTYANAACAWRGFATRQKVTNTVPGYAAQTRTVDYVVDPSNLEACRVYQEIVEPTELATSALRVTTTFGYDVFGHPNSRTISGQDIEPRVTTTSFGTQGVFPESVIKSVSSSFSQTESKTYDFALGVPKTATDPNGLVTIFGYDGFGRLIEETRPDGTRSEVVYSACSVASGYCGDSRLRYSVTANELDATTPGAVLDTSVQRFDGLGRALYEESRTVSGASAVVATSYDNQGRVSQRSQPYFSGNPVYFTTFSYDLLGRPTQEQRQISEATSGTQTVKYGYQRLTQTFEDANGKVTTKKHNAIGQVVQVTDAASGVTTYEFDQFGNLRKTTDPAGNQIVSTFNVRGFKETLNDPDLGNWSYTYYPTGELRTQTDAKNQVVTFIYDRLARPKTRVEPEGTTTFTYGDSAAAKNIGKMQAVSAPGGYSESFVYDSLGRLQDATINADATSFVISKTYNATTGYLETLTYPASTTAVPNSRFKIKYEYQNGQMARVRDFNTPSTVYWESVSTNAAGQVIDEQYGNGVRTYSAYDGITGLLGERTAGTSAQVQNLTYQWDKVGNLTQRRDLALSHTEDFTYDELNRLKTSKLNNVANLSLTYYANGNIQTKSDVGTYGYPLAGAARPHAVTSAGSRSFGYDVNGNMNSRDGSTITWYSFNKPNRINQGSSYSQLYYDADHSRYKQVAYTAAGGSLPAGTETTIYISGLFEKVTKPSGVLEYKHYVMAGNDPIAIRTLRSNSSNDTRYLHRDHIGSVTAITDESGAVLQRLSYDAFGKRRNATSWSEALTTGDWTSIASITHRAFTFHEQLDNVDLINMNGRVYDPGVGRFISADPFVQAPLMSQSLNRYSYVMNNPLSLVDPSGYSWLSKAIKSVGNFIKTYWREIVAVIVVVVSMGTLGPIVGAAGGFWGAVAVGATAGAIYGATVTALYGGDLGDIVTGAVTGAIVGGIAAGATYGMGQLFSSPSQPGAAEKPIDFGVKSMEQQASDTVKRQISSTGINAETVAAITAAYHVLSKKDRAKLNASITNTASELLIQLNGMDERQFTQQFTMPGSDERRYLQSNSAAAYLAKGKMVDDLTALLTKGMMGVGKQGTEWAIESGRDAMISKGVGKLVGLTGEAAAKAFDSARKAIKAGDKLAYKMEPGKLVFDGIQCGVSDPVSGCTALFSVTE